MTTPAPKRILSGVQPTGKLHLGNYFGAIKQHIALQNEGVSFYFLADYHSMTTIQDAATRRTLTYSVGVTGVPSSHVFAVSIDRDSAGTKGPVLRRLSGEGVAGVKGSVILTDAERRYVRDRPETMAGRWAAKEAVSKVLGLGVRGIGWRDIEIERLPTGQPAVQLHGRAASRAEQLGMGRIAVSISHEADYAVAIAFGVRTLGGRYVFPPDIEARIDEREARILARLDRLRTLHEAAPRDA